MKEQSNKKHSLCMAIAWTFSATFTGIAAWFRGVNPLQTVIAVFFIVDAAIWWLRWYHLNDDSKKQEETNHE